MLGEPFAAVPSASRRFYAGSDADVDAYLLGDGRFFLFCHLKDERLGEGEAYARSLAATFPSGTVVGVGRASKTERVSTPLSPIWLAEPPPGGELWAVEGDVRFRLEAERVLNPGLFLDQRDNRQQLARLVREARGDLAADEGLLNLFSYTGAFSLVARRAGLVRTTSVDLSQRYLGWERQNFDANFAGTTAATEAPRLIRDDAREFLRRAVKKGARYRFIVIDPPTFSRAEKKNFRVQEDLVPLARDALACLPQGEFGAVFVSTNDAGWNDDAFYRAMTSVAEDAGVGVERGRIPAEFGVAYPLKSAWLVRR